MSDLVDVDYAQEHVVFVRGTAAMAQQIDLSSHQLIGPVTTIAADVLAGGSFPGAALSVSEQGHMVYQSGTAAGEARLEWFDQSGQPLGALSDYGDYSRGPSTRTWRAALEFHDYG